MGGIQEQGDNRLPVIVIGCGPVGVRFAENWLAYQEEIPVLLFGDEPHAPYERIQLGRLLQNATKTAPTELELSLPSNHPRLHIHLNQRVTCINPATHSIQTARGEQYAYRQLVLATGASAYIPPIPGINLAGVHVLRTMTDAVSIRQRLVHVRHIVILGGGLLGLETAYPLLASGRPVHIIERNTTLLSAQDATTRQQIIQKLQNFPNLFTHLQSGIRRILGTNQVSAVELLNGVQLSCDLLIISTGVRPNIALAQAAGLQANHGIVVDDCLQTSTMDIFAIGDCVEHRGKTYGLVTPGYEQAEILARRLRGEATTYTGSSALTRPKLALIKPDSIPADHLVCECNQVTHGQLIAAISNGCHSLQALRDKTKAGGNCGSCRPALAELLDKTQASPPTQRQKILQVAAFTTIFTGLLYLLIPGLQYQDSVMAGIQWDELWRNKLSRQITGFSLMGISIMLSIIGIRKRLLGFRWGEFSNWRNAHVLLGLLILVTLLIHTGARFGENLNLALMLCFIGVLLSGGLLASSIANEHRLTPRQARRLRLGSLWLHLLLLWPLPALLLFHVFKSYYF